LVPLKVRVALPLPAGRVAGVIGVFGSTTIAGVVRLTVMEAVAGVVPVSPTAVKVMTYCRFPLVNAGIVEPAEKRG